MKKFLSLILSVVLVLGIAVSPAFALTTEEITNNVGDNWEIISVVDLGEGLSATSTSTGSAVAGTLVSMGTNVEYSENGVKWPLMEFDGAPISKADLVRAYPHLESNTMNDAYLKWTQTQRGSMLRVRKMLKNNIVKNGDTIRMSMEICATDMVGGMNSDGTYLPADGIDSYSIAFYPVYSQSETDDSKTTDGTSVTCKLPVNRWTTISAYVTITKDLFSSIRLSQVNAGYEAAVKSPYPRTFLLGRVIVEKLVPNNQPMENKIKYSEDFERYNNATDTYTVDGTKATNEVVTTKKYPVVTPVATADSGVFGEENMVYADSANPNDKTKYAVGKNGNYQYVYPTSGTAQGKYHLYGDASMGDTGVKDATFGIGYAGLEHITSNDNHLSAADRLTSSNNKRSVVTLPDAHSGKHMLVASGLYNKYASVRFNNIFGSHPVSSDIGKKFKVSFYVYADSKMGAYQSGTGAYSASTPIAVDTSKPVSLTVCNNGPVGNIYKYNSSYTETAVGTFEIPWDRWTKVEFPYEITTESIDDLKIDNLANSLRNSLQISQYNAQEQIADTLYFDDFSLEELEVRTKATFSAYSFDGSYDIAAKITSTTITEESTVQLVVAEYEANTGRLLAVYTSLPQKVNFKTVPVAVSITNVKPINTNNTMRAYLIDSYTGLCPYISPANVASIIEVIE